MRFARHRGAVRKRVARGLGVGILFASAAAWAVGPPTELVSLRDAGIAHLENEDLEDAEGVFRELVRKAPDRLLGHANLAIALFRQHEHEKALAAIGKARAIDAECADVHAIEGQILDGSGKYPEALASLRKAGELAVDDPEIQLDLLRAAKLVGGTAGADAAGEALARLVRLRPENLVVLAERLERSLAAADRTESTGAALRIREILEGSGAKAPASLESLLDGLERDDSEGAVRDGRRLANVLKAEPFYQLGLRELSQGLRGRPIERFDDEPAPEAFGEPVPITLHADRVATGSTTSLDVGDLDGDGRAELVRLANDAIEVRSGASDWRDVSRTLAAADLRGVRLADVDGDQTLELVAWGSGGFFVFGPTGERQRSFAPAEGEIHGVSIFDFDLEGDVDVAVVAGPKRRVVLYRNTPDGRFERVEGAIPEAMAEPAAAIEWSDVDRDGDPDLVVAGANGTTWLENLRQDRFRVHAPIEPAEPVAALAVGDLDGDGAPDVVTAGRDGRVSWQGLAEETRGGLVLEAMDGAIAPSLLVADVDNDGRLEVVVARADGTSVSRCRNDACSRFEITARAEEAIGPGDTAAVDQDVDGDLDLVTAGPDGVRLLRNDGGNRNAWLSVALRGLTTGNGKNNSFGIGATIEVRSGRARQWREVRRDPTHLGLGSRKRADVVRVVWTNGVPQNRLRVAGRRTIVEEQVLKGSCPFLYAWDGRRFAFVTDLLWGAPLGMPVAPGVWAGWDARELVHVPRARPRAGRYEMRITEELWEAAYFDSVRLWVVDAPADVEVASSFRVIPGRVVDDRVLGSRDVRPVAKALDGNGRDVTERVRSRDDRYADGFARGPVQGVADRPWTFTLDLGRAVEGAVRLHLDGWIFPADASLNVASGQGRGLRQVLPRLEVETPSGWVVLMENLGFPPGKTKTIVVDTPPLPEGSRRLRIVTTAWISWDRVAWTTTPADDLPVVRAVVAPVTAELRPRGFSRWVRVAPNAPHAFRYEDVVVESPWLPFPGPYTRFGDVRELLSETDDRHVILAAGDEMALVFEPGALDEVPAGWSRTVFLESTGWDKDADRNTWAPDGVEPLPFHAMTSYPFAAGESYPDDERLRRYRREWLTRP